MSGEPKGLALSYPLVWERAARLDPQIAALLREAQEERPGPDGRYCANYHWYERFKPQVVKMVGWAAKPWSTVAPGDVAFLKSERAYDVVYQTIYDALPNCNGCSCL